MSNLDKLIAYFEKFPGVGARQAKRFAFHVLTMPDTDSDELSMLISKLKVHTTHCDSCHRFFPAADSQKMCSLCLSGHRDHTRLLVVESDNDITAVERAGVYDGLYFVLGGSVPLLNSEQTNKLRGGLLRSTVVARLPEGLKEIILGFSVNPDGENTARFVESILTPILVGAEVKISHLGRGLSTGSELEYADTETIKNALRNRQ